MVVVVVVVGAPFLEEEDAASDMVVVDDVVMDAMPSMISGNDGVMARLVVDDESD